MFHNAILISARSTRANFALEIFWVSEVILNCMLCPRPDAAFLNIKRNWLYEKFLRKQGMTYMNDELRESLKWMVVATGISLLWSITMSHVDEKNMKTRFSV